MTGQLFAIASSPHLTRCFFPDLKDKESQIRHVKTVYSDVQETSGSLVMAAQSITNSINHYAQANQLDIKVHTIG